MRSGAMAQHWCTAAVAVYIMMLQLGCRRRAHGQLEPHRTIRMIILLGTFRVTNSVTTQDACPTAYVYSCTANYVRSAERESKAI